MSTPFSTGPAPANTNAVLTVKGQLGKSICLYHIIASYNAAPTGGRLQIVGSESGWQYDVDITAAGPTPSIGIGDGLEFQVGEDVVLTLAAAGAAVTGKINCAAKWKDSEY